MKKLVEFTLGCLLILLYVGATLLYAQNSALNNFIITGVVKDKDNRKKLDNVNLESGRRTTMGRPSSRWVTPSPAR